MSELALLLKDASPFFIAAFVALILGRQYLSVRAKEADASVIKAAADKETAKYQSEAEIRRDARDEKVALELAQYRAQQTANVASTAQALQQNTAIQGQTVAAIATLTGQQSASESVVTSAIEKSGADVISRVDASKDEVIAVVRLLAKVNTGIFKPAGTEPPDLATMYLILEETDRAIQTAQARAAVVAAQIEATKAADAGTAATDDGEELPIAS